MKRLFQSIGRLAFVSLITVSLSQAQSDDECLTWYLSSAQSQQIGSISINYVAQLSMQDLTLKTAAVDLLDEGQSLIDSGVFSITREQANGDLALKITEICRKVVGRGICICTIIKQL